MAGGTVGFNVKWYSTPDFPFVDVNYPVTTGVVIADFNRDGIPDVAYSYPCCGEFGSSGGGVIVKLGTGGGNLGPDVPYRFGQNDLGELATADINGDGWLDIMVRHINDSAISVFLNNGDGTFQYSAIVGLGGVHAVHSPWEILTMTARLIWLRSAATLPTADFLVALSIAC